MKHNDLDIANWKELDVNVDSLWLIGERDKSGKHSNIYHGNFVPQIPNQLIRRYTKKNEIVLDPFLGSGTTLFEAENLERRCIGCDINVEMIDYVNSHRLNSTGEISAVLNCDVTDERLFDKLMRPQLAKMKKEKTQFVIMHPPYMDIVKFTDQQEDLSQISELPVFIDQFTLAAGNVLSYLDDQRYFAIVIGDLYKKSEVIPLAFYVMNAIKKTFRVKLKGIIVKNIEGNRGKLGKGGIWRYRALKSDYYIFKHEYILVFKKEF